MDDFGNPVDVVRITCSQILKLFTFAIFDYECIWWRSSQKHVFAH